jgi:hypothetical protein
MRHAQIRANMPTRERTSVNKSKHSSDILMIFSLFTHNVRGLEHGGLNTHIVCRLKHDSFNYTYSMHGSLKTQNMCGTGAQQPGHLGSCIGINTLVQSNIRLASSEQRLDVCCSQIESLVAFGKHTIEVALLVKASRLVHVQHALEVLDLICVLTLALLILDQLKRLVVLVQCLALACDSVLVSMHAKFVFSLNAFSYLFNACRSVYACIYVCMFPMCARLIQNTQNAWSCLFCVYVLLHMSHVCAGAHKHFEHHKKFMHLRA